MPSDFGVYVRDVSVPDYQPYSAMFRDPGFARYETPMAPRRYQPYEGLYNAPRPFQPRATYLRPTHSSAGHLPPGDIRQDTRAYYEPGLVYVCGGVFASDFVGYADPLGPAPKLPANDLRSKL
jgi:hypothetical protein